MKELILGGSALDAAKAIGLFCEYPALDFAAALAGKLPTCRRAWAGN